MATLQFYYDEDDTEEVNLADGSSLTEPCQLEGIPFSCTEGTCKTCVIEVLEGMENLSEYSKEEQALLGGVGKQRLACQCRILSETVRISY